MKKLLRLYLKEGREISVLAGHPWIFSGAVREIMGGDPSPGDLCKIYSSKKEFLGIGYLNPSSSIICRVLTLEDVSINKDFFRSRLISAFKLRKRFFDDSVTNSYRLINSEGDFLPGVVVDKYKDGFVVQFVTAGSRAFKSEIIDVLLSEFSPKFIFERSDTFAIREEHIAPEIGVIYGDVPSVLEIMENGYKFLVDIQGGQKTGFFFDQRDNRSFLSLHLVDRSFRNAADIFSYTGAFSVYLASLDIGSLYVVDRSSSALSIAKKNIELNGYNKKVLFFKQDAFDFLDKTNVVFDLIILDPPPFARTKKDVDSALKGYRRLNYLALKKLNTGGFLATFSCSHHISWELFLKEFFMASFQSGRRVQIIKRFSHPVDHPVNVAHREGDYLRGILARVV